MAGCKLLEITPLPSPESANKILPLHFKEKKRNMYRWRGNKTSEVFHLRHFYVTLLQSSFSKKGQAYELNYRNPGLFANSFFYMVSNMNFRNVK